MALSLNFLPFELHIMNHLLIITIQTPINSEHDTADKTWLYSNCLFVKQIIFFIYTFTFELFQIFTLVTYITLLYFGIVSLGS